MTILIMLNKLSAIANRPKKTPTRSQLMSILGVQAFLLLSILFVTVFYPERFFAISTLVFLCFGISTMLWLEAYEGRIGRTETNIPIAEAKKESK